MKSWICCLCAMCVLVGTLEATAQVRPPRRKHRILVDPSAKKKQNTVKAIWVKASKILRNAPTRLAENPKVDVVFVVDGNKRMLASIAVLEKKLVDMLAVIEAKTMDYRFALVEFSIDTGRTALQRFITGPLTISVLKMPCRKYGASSTRGLNLDMGLMAVVKGLKELDFREDVTTQFVVIGNSRMRTSWAEAGAKSRVSEQIVNLCQQNSVQLNFIGTSEKIQAELTDQTGGKWYPIDSNQQRMDGQRIRSGDIVADKALLRVDGLFKRIAENLVSHEPDKVDIVFVFDYSVSMETKTDAAW